VDCGQQRSALLGADLAVIPGIAAGRDVALRAPRPHSALRFRLSLGTLTTLGLTALLVVVTYAVSQLHCLLVPTDDLWPPVALIGVLLALAYFYRRRGEASFVLCLSALSQIVAFATCYVLAMYTLATLGWPLVDARLAAFDAGCGIHVPHLCQWAENHPSLAVVLRIAYDSLLYQTAAVIALLGLRGDRRRLETFIVSFMLAALIALAIFVAMPARGPFAEYGLIPAADQARFIEHFHSLRNGSRTVISYRGAEGLITFPSFHVAWALVIVWALRGSRRVFPLVAVLNVLLIVSTMTTGWHYFADVLGGAAVAIVAILGAMALITKLENISRGALDLPGGLRLPLAGTGERHT
jgi:hypothetical protein